MSDGGHIVNEACGRVTYAAPDVAQQSFRRLRQFFDDGQLCDVQLHVGSRSWRCHRLVLACCSPYFHAMFTTPLAESQQQVGHLTRSITTVLALVMVLALEATRFSLDLDCECSACERDRQTDTSADFEPKKI
ncbi:hypothetical protein MRX96_038658 [Rhipicephalus microplus]